MSVWVMFLLINITIIAIHLAYPYAASDKFFCTEPDKGAESFLQLTEATTSWNGMKMNFITRFSDVRNKFHNRLEVEHCWPDDTNGVPNAQQKAERTTQERQQKQIYMDYNLRRLKPNYLQLKAREQLLECRTLPGMTFLLIIFKKISRYKYARTFHMMWNKLNLN